MKLFSVLKIVMSGFMVLTLSACAKGGKSDKRNTNIYGNSRYRNGTYGNGLNQQNGLYGGQATQQYQQIGQMAQPTYPAPVKQVRVTHEDRIDDADLATDADVVSGEVVRDEDDQDDNREHRRHQHYPRPPAPAPEQPISQPVARIPVEPPANMPKTRLPREKAPTVTPSPVQKPCVCKPSQQPTPITQTPVAPPVVKPELPAAPPAVKPELPVKAQVPTKSAGLLRGGIEIVYKDQLDGRNLSRSQPALSQTAYKSMIDDLLRQTDLHDYDLAMAINESTYPSSWKKGERYYYGLEALVTKLIESGACSWEEKHVCLAVETRQNGSVVGYYIAITGKVLNTLGSIRTNVLRRDITNNAKLEKYVSQLSRIENTGIVVYSQIESSQALTAGDRENQKPVQLNDKCDDELPKAAPVKTSPAAPAAVSQQRTVVQLPGQVRIPDANNTTD